MQLDRIVPGTVVEGRFEIERLANSGGMGDVFRARDLQTGHPVAVKLVKNTDESHLTRFEREARTLAQFEHPGIVRYIAHGSRPVFLAMEWLEGEDLSRRLSRGPLTIAETLVLAKSVTEALAAAHARGIVHRDIKPSNIFLCGGRIDAAKVLDFGVAQVNASTRAITNTGQLIGTIGYMAPEQALSGRDITPAADVYSLGCVFFECLSGNAPFSGEWAQVLSKIILSDPPRVRESRKDVPIALDELIARMLRRDPITRASLSVVAGDVATFLTTGDVMSDDTRPSGSIPAVTGDERRLFSIVVTETPQRRTRVEGVHAGDTLVSGREAGIATVVEKFGGDVAVLADGTTVVTLTGGTGGVDLVSRAAKCALALREVTGGARVALASGRGDPVRDASVGDIMDRARAMLAADGDKAGLRIDSVTAGFLDSSFVVRGDDAALVLVGQRAQSAVRQLLGKPTPLVGREREVALLEGLVSECIDEPLATAIVLTGNPGVGKTRMRYELVRAWRERAPTGETWVARADPIAVGSPLGMLGQLLRHMSGIDEAEAVAVQKQKLLARIGRNLAADVAAAVAEPLYEIAVTSSLHARPSIRTTRQDPAVLTDRVRRAWDDLIAAEIAVAPIAIVLEDLQWGDLPTIRVIDSSLRNHRHRPLLVVSVARPEVHESFPGLFRDRRVHEVRLAELTAGAARRLVLEVLGPDAAATVADALVERSHGNAFYLEELIRGVAEGESALPETVLATAQARLQRLEPSARRILRAASVFGTRFWLGGVAALVRAESADDVRDAIEVLVQRELIAPESSSRFAGNEEYSFRHILSRDAAYEMLTERDRKHAHSLAADWLEANGERDALVLAEHLERSDERHRAVVWYLWAAEQALDRNDLASVIARAQRGIECGATGALLGELTLLKAEASGWAGHDVHFKLAEDALKLLPAGSAPWSRAAAELAVASRAIGNDDRLQSIAARVDAVPRGVPTIGHAWALARIVVELLGAEHHDFAERLLRAIESITASAEEEDRATLTALTRWLRASAELRRGNARALLECATEIAHTFEEAGNARWAALVALDATMAAAKLRDTRLGVSWGERAGDLARRLGLHSCEVRARAWLAWHLADSGLVDAATTAAESAVRDAAGDRVAESDARAVLAHVLDGRARAPDRT